MVTTTLYLKKDRTFSAKKTSFDQTGFDAAMWNESFRRQYPAAVEPTAWGLRSNSSGKLARLTKSRDEARALRKNNQTVVAVWA